MPYKDRGKWRGVVKISGKRYSMSFMTKREALVWERNYRDKAMIPSNALDFLSFSGKYLEYAGTRFSANVYKEKIKSSE